MSQPTAGQKQLKGLTIYADKYNCSPHWGGEDQAQRIGGVVIHKRRFTFRIDRHRRFRKDDGMNFQLAIKEWDYDSRQDVCEFAVYYNVNTRLERPFERYITSTGWKVGLQRSLRRQQYRNYTWRDTTKWIVVAAAEKLVPDGCDQAPPDWSWSRVYPTGRD